MNMKKASMLILIVGLCVIFSTFCNSFVFGVNDLGEGFDYGNVPKSGSSDLSKIQKPVKKVWSTVIYVFQIASVVGIITMGVRYMFSNADKKADIKKSTILTIIGIILVFAASTFIGFIVNAFTEIIS